VSKFERLFVLGSTELPDCRCGSEMKIVKSDAIGSDGEVRIYRCPQCEHELRLTAWKSSCDFFGKRSLYSLMQFP